MGGAVALSWRSQSLSLCQSFIIGRVVILVRILHLLGTCLLCVFLVLRVVGGIRDARRRYATHGQAFLRDMKVVGPAARYVMMVNVGFLAFIGLAALTIPFVAVRALVRLLEHQYRVGTSVTWLEALMLVATSGLGLFYALKNQAMLRDVLEAYSRDGTFVARGQTYEGSAARTLMRRRVAMLAFAGACAIALFVLGGGVLLHSLGEPSEIRSIRGNPPRAFENAPPDL